MNTNHALTLAAYMLNECRVSEDPWHELATGGLTRGQVAQIRRHLEPQEQIDAKLALFSPASEEVTERRLEMLLERFLTPGPGAERGGADDPSLVRGESDNVVSLGEGSSRKDRGWGTTTIVSIAAMAAAVLILWVVQRPTPAPERPLKTMGVFELRFQGGWSGEMRGDRDPEGAEECDIRYHRDRSMSVYLSPPEALDEDLAVAAFVRSESGEERWLRNLSPKQRDNGVLRIQQSIADLGLEPGAWAITFYVTSRGQRHDPVGLRTLKPGAHPGVSVAEGSVCIVD